MLGKMRCVCNNSCDVESPCTNSHPTCSRLRHPSASCALKGLQLRKNCPIFFIEKDISWILSQSSCRRISSGASVVGQNCLSKMTDLTSVLSCNLCKLSCPNAGLRWGWVFLERTQILSGIQFTKHFIECFVVDTKQFVDSTVNVILTRQTCGQRSSRAAESKRRAIEYHFHERICHMFLTPKYRVDWDLGLCTFCVLAKRELLRNAKFRFVLQGKQVFFPGSCHCAAVLITQVPKKCQTLISVSSTFWY